MAEKYKENTLFQPLMQLSSKTKMAAQAAQGAKNRVPAPTANYSGLVNTVKNAKLGNLGTVTTPYGGSTRYEQFHPGVDIAAATGTPIPSFAPGTVTEVSTGHRQGEKNYGNYVVVTDPYGNQSRYSHLANAYVKVGQPVTLGMIIGAMGNTGNTYSPSGKGTGTHLDFRVVDAFRKYMDPNTYLSQYKFS